MNKLIVSGLSVLLATNPTMSTTHILTADDWHEEPSYEVTDRNYCDAWGCFDEYGNYSQITYEDTYTDESWSDDYWYEEEYYYEESWDWYDEPTWSDYGSYYDLYWYNGKTLQIGGYSSVINADGEQWAVDAPNSAGIEYYNIICIMDHASQGFSVIKYTDVAYIGGVKFIKIAQYNNAVNRLTWIEVSPGVDVGYACDAPIAMYTCNDWSGMNFTVTYWIPVE